MTIRRLLAIAALTVACGVVSSSARADALIDFGTGLAGKGGTISYAGGTAALVVSNTRIGVVTGRTPIRRLIADVATPEPASLLLLGTGLMLAGATLRRKQLSTMV